MISVIISSYREDYFNNLKDIVKHTIGVPHEIIRISNNQEMSIATAYNQGGKKAQYEYLCFLHEDINIHTANWGQMLIHHFFENPYTGVVGVAGSTIKPPIPTGWFTFLSRHDHIHIIQHDQHRMPYLQSSFTNKSEKAQKMMVKVLDGVLLFTRRAVWLSFQFDENNQGYHFYDIDFSLRVSQKYRNYVTSKILIEHYSLGNFGNQWILAAIRYQKERKKSELFDKTEDVPLIRNKWYRFLSKQDIDLWNKIKYIFSMGVDKSSIPYVILFLQSKRDTPEIF